MAFWKKNRFSISFDDYCDQIYDFFINNHDTDSEIEEIYHEMHRITQDSCDAIDKQRFIIEVKAVTLELFGCAVGQHFNTHENILDEPRNAESYMRKNYKTDIWEAMCSYNQALKIAEIESYYISFGINKPTEEEIRRNPIKKKIEQFISSMVEQGYEQHIAEIAASRISSSWINTRYIDILAIHLSKRIGCNNEQSEMIIKLPRMLCSLYNTHVEGLKEYF